MEVRGTIFKAATEESKSGKAVFKVGIRPDDGKDWELMIFDPDLIEKVAKCKGERVVAIVEKNDKFWNLKSIQTFKADVIDKPTQSPTSAGDPRQQSIEEQVAVKAAVELIVADKCPDDIRQNALLWIAARIPGKVQPPKDMFPDEPEGLFDNDGQITGKQITALKQKLKLKTNDELRIAAEERWKRDVVNLSALSEAGAAKWLEDLG